MANTRELKARIASAEGILQITKSMKMVSASKLRRVQAAWNRMEPMREGSQRLLSQVLAGMEAPGEPRYDLSLDAGDYGEPLLEDRPEKKRACYVLLEGNRGLCGVYNTALLKYLEDCLQKEDRDWSLVVCGSWGQDVIEPALPVLRRFAAFGDVPTAAEAEELTDFLRRLYVSGEADEIFFVYQRYDSFLKQTPCRTRFLPAQPAEGSAGLTDWIFEPDKQSLIRMLTELYVGSMAYGLLLEARTGEHAARMASMTAAADNTQELIAKLTLALNHARQAAITTEISEIAGGAEALNGSRT